MQHRQSRGSIHRSSLAEGSPPGKRVSLGASPPRRPSTAPSAAARTHPALGAALRKATLGVRVGAALAAGASPQPKPSSNNIKVGVRCRPLNRTEKDMDDEFIIEFSENNELCISNPSPGTGEAEDSLFAFDHCYEPDSQSETVFEQMGRPLVDGLYDGFNGTIFAYGQTGSGKTHSMMGNADDPGVIPRVCDAILERGGFGSSGGGSSGGDGDGEGEGGASSLDAQLEEASGSGGGEGERVVVVTASYLQIYREVLQDLLGGGDGDLKIRRDPKLGTIVQGLTEHPLSSADALARLIDTGNRKRAVASTLMNSESSRSHAVVIIRVDQETTTTVGGMKTKKKVGSKINLVDLAGSERASKTGASGETLKEAISINQSLSALGNVINALTDTKHKGHIPFRSSKLTHLLEESLGGNSQTVMLAAISPAARNYSETLNTLQYAQRAKMIVTQATANVSTEAVGRRKTMFGGGMQEQEAQMAAQLEAQKAEFEAQMAAQMGALQAGGGIGGGGGADIRELRQAQQDLASAQSQLAAAQAVQGLQQQQLDAAQARAGDAERLRAGDADMAARREADAQAEIVAARAGPTAREAAARAASEAARAAEDGRAQLAEARLRAEAAEAESARAREELAREKEARGGGGGGGGGAARRGRGALGAARAGGGGAAPRPHDRTARRGEIAASRGGGTRGAPRRAGG